MPPLLLAIVVLGNGTRVTPSATIPGFVPIALYLLERPAAGNMLTASIALVDERVKSSNTLSLLKAGIGRGHSVPLDREPGSLRDLSATEGFVAAGLSAAPFGEALRVVATE